MDRSISSDMTIILSSGNEHTVHDATSSSSFTTTKVTKKYKRNPVLAPTVSSPNEFIGLISPLANSMMTLSNMNQNNRIQTSTHTSNKPSHILTADKLYVLYKQIDLYNEKMKTIKDEIENKNNDIKKHIQKDTYDSFYKNWTKMHKTIQIFNGEDDSDTDNN